MNLPTASSLPRVMRCPASHVLPQSPDVTSRAAAAGTKRHAAIADVLTGRAPRDSIDWPVHEILGIEDGDAVHVERAFRLHLDTGVADVLGDEIGRAYPPRGAGMIDGTADVIVDHADGPRVLVDWKGRDGAGSVRANWQLRTLALMAQADIVAIVALDGSEYEIDATEMSIADHRATLAALQDMAERLRAFEDAPAWAVTTGVFPGDHCRYCPAKAACPAYATTARDLETVGVIDRARAELATPEGVGQWYEWTKRARSVLESIDKLVRERLAEGNGVLPDGRVVHLSTTTPRKLDGRIALRVLRERFGDDADSAASVSIAAAERVAKGHAPKGQGAAEVRALHAALADAGAISDDTPRTSIVVDDAKGGAS